MCAYVWLSVHLTYELCRLPLQSCQPQQISFSSPSSLNRLILLFLTQSFSVLTKSFTPDGEIVIFSVVLFQNNHRKWKNKADTEETHNNHLCKQVGVTVSALQGNIALGLDRSQQRIASSEPLHAQKNGSWFTLNFLFRGWNPFTHTSHLTLCDANGIGKVGRRFSLNTIYLVTCGWKACSRFTGNVIDSLD